MTNSLDSRSATNQAAGLVGWLLLTLAAAAIGAAASTEAGSFYAQLSRPAWAPPGWLFGPVWSVLYVLMAMSAWLVWRGSRLRDSWQALALFVVQLAANALWSWLFFVWNKGAWAFAEVLLLASLIALTAIQFRRYSVAAALLLLPYLAWVGFAAALTWTTWQRNPAILG